MHVLDFTDGGSGLIKHVRVRIDDIITFQSIMKGYFREETEARAGALAYWPEEEIKEDTLRVVHIYTEAREKSKSINRSCP